MGARFGDVFALGVTDLRFRAASFARFLGLDRLRVVDLRFELRRLAMKCSAATRAVEGTGLAQCEVERSSARACRLESIVAAADAVPILRLVGAESTADGAAFDQGRHYRNIKGTNDAKVKGTNDAKVKGTNDAGKLRWGKGAGKRRLETSFGDDV